MSLAYYGKHTESNPRYQAAVKAQKARDAERRSADTLVTDERKAYWRSIQEKRDRELAMLIKESRFQREFLYDITRRRLAAMHPLERHAASLGSSGPTVRLKADDIIRYHADKHGFKVGELLSNRRFRSIVAARQAAMADVYVNCPHLSLPQIGRLFGGRDHTTVLHAVTKMGVHESQTGITRAHGNLILAAELRGQS